VIEQQIFALVQIGYVLIAVVGLYARRRERLREFGDLVLHLGIVGQVPEVPDIHVRRPLAGTALLLVHLSIVSIHPGIDHLAHAPREDAAYRNEDR
jgi:hypothetical protein